MKGFIFHGDKICAEPGLAPANLAWKEEPSLSPIFCPF